MKTMIQHKQLTPGLVFSELPLNHVSKFRALLFVINHPNRICPGFTPTLHVHTAMVPVKVEAFMNKRDRRSGKVVEENPHFVK